MYTSILSRIFSSQYRFIKLLWRFILFASTSAFICYLLMTLRVNRLYNNIKEAGEEHMKSVPRPSNIHDVLFANSSFRDQLTKAAAPYFTPVKSFCDGNIVLHGETLVMIRNAVINVKAVSGPIGGEPIKSVFGQHESVEYLHFKAGFLQCGCVKAELRKLRTTHMENRLREVIESMTPYSDAHAQNKFGKYAPMETLFFVRRGAYANIYHAILSWYDVVLSMAYFQLRSSDVHVLLVDGHPHGSLDENWHYLFPKAVSRIGDYRLPASLKFGERLLPVEGTTGNIYVKYLVFIPFEYSSPLFTRTAYMVDDFRNFILRSFGITPAAPLSSIPSDQVKCKPSVLLLWRHDYLAHPRNPKGVTSRKIANEDELEKALLDAQDSNGEPLVEKVVAASFEHMPFSEQLKLSNAADILFGMHGAGLTHSIFLPPDGALLEMFPSYCCRTFNHFEKVCTWRHLIYEKFMEPASGGWSTKPLTTVPPDLFIAAMRKIVSHWTEARPSCQKT